MDGFDYCIMNFPVQLRAIKLYERSSPSSQSAIGTVVLHQPNTLILIVMQLLWRKSSLILSIY